MSDEQLFRKQCASEIAAQGESQDFRRLTERWVNESIKTKYSYHFEWLGRPIIQYPQDIVGMQQLLWEVQPDLIIETGIARGGSILFYASILELIAQCGGPADATVFGIDIDIRSHNKEAILSHPMSKRIDMVEGSSLDKSIVSKVWDLAGNKKRIMICLDSNHTHEHVLRELQLYAPLVSQDSYAVVFDTVVEDLPPELIGERPWSKGNSPLTAVYEYLEDANEGKILGADGARLTFEIDEKVDHQLMISVARNGYLKRVSA